MTTTKIARLAGVSQATVSRVINQHSNELTENVQAVEEAMRRMKYTPRPRRRRSERAATRPSGNVAVLLLDESYANHSTLAMQKLQGVCAALREAKLNMIFAEVTSPDDLPPMVATGKVDGVLLWGHRMPQGVSAKLKHIPSTWLSSHAGEGAQSTLAGNEATGRVAADYLIEQGCQRLAVLNAAGELSSHRARVEGFEFAAHRAGLEIMLLSGEDSDHQNSQRWNPRDLEPRVAMLIDQLLALETLPDGLFIPNDQVTAIAHRLLKARNVDLQSKLRLVSAGNDEPYLLGLDPRPATIDLGPELTGRCAVQQLLWKIQNPNEAARVQVSVEPRLVPPCDDNGAGRNE